jgi:hypothetical protein
MKSEDADLHLIFLLFLGEVRTPEFLCQGQGSADSSIFFVLRKKLFLS